jgi:hypothetical protein
VCELVPVCVGPNTIISFFLNNCTYFFTYKGVGSSGLLFSTVVASCGWDSPATNASLLGLCVCSIVNTERKQCGYKFCMNCNKGQARRTYR